jgi:hypothetical protein
MVRVLKTFLHVHPDQRILAPDRCAVMHFMDLRREEMGNKIDNTELILFRGIKTHANRRV